MFVPFNYIVTEAIHYGMKPALALSLVSIMNGARYDESHYPILLFGTT